VRTHFRKFISRRRSRRKASRTSVVDNNTPGPSHENDAAEVVTVSEKKLQENTCIMDEDFEDVSTPLTGYRLFDVEVLADLVNVVGVCPECHSKVGLSETCKQGLAFEMKISCFKCSFEYSFWSSKKKEKKVRH